MVELLRRRALMVAEAEEPGIDYFKFSKTVTVQNAGTATLPSAVAPVVYLDPVILATPAVNSGRPGTSFTYNNLATDGVHIWLGFDRVSTVTYNGTPLQYKKSGSFWQIEIPDNFDPSIPLVFS